MKMHQFQRFKPVSLNYRSHSPCIPKHPGERIVASHCSSLHTKDLPLTTLSTSSWPDLSHMLPKFSSLSHVTLLVSTQNLCCILKHMHKSLQIKRLATPGHLPIRYHQLLSSHYPAHFHPFAQSGDSCLSFICDRGTC